MSAGTDDILGVAGPYDLIKKLGAGGMGEVFLARHRVLNRYAVVKRILPEHTENADLVRRFENEAKAAGKLSHRNVVEVLDVAKSPDGRWYLVLEYLRGASLADWMASWSQRNRRPVGPGFATIILAQAANALRTAHVAGIVHRDVKPDNIFLTNATCIASATEHAKWLQQAGLPLDLFVKLLDFGIAKLRGVEGGPGTQTGVGIGTLSYMAPEQWESARDVDDRADVYALGVVAYQLLAGGALPWGDTPGPVLYKRQTTEPPPDVRALVPTVSPELAEIVRGALACSPRDRPSVRELALAFARAVPAQDGLPDGLTLLGAYAEELLITGPDERTRGRVEIPPGLPATAPLGRKGQAPVPVLPIPSPWGTNEMASSAVAHPTTHSSAIQVRPSNASTPSSTRRTLLVSLGAAAVVVGAVAVAVMSGDGSSADGSATPVSEGTPNPRHESAVAPPESATPDAGTDSAEDAVAPPADAAVPPDAAAPVDAQEIDAGRRNRTRPPTDKGDGSGPARGFRDLTK